LSNWSECPSWEKGSFLVAPFSGMDFTNNPCEYFTKGKVKACTLSLSVLVMIEMFNAFNALSEDNSLLVMPPWINMYLILAILGSVGSHLVIL
jgi:Ca2+-transporting ATPase